MLRAKLTRVAMLVFVSVLFVIYSCNVPTEPEIVHNTDTMYVAYTNNFLLQCVGYWKMHPDSNYLCILWRYEIEQQDHTELDSVFFVSKIYSRDEKTVYDYTEDHIITRDGWGIQGAKGSGKVYTGELPESTLYGNLLRSEKCTMSEKLFLVLIVLYFANSFVFLYLGHLITAKSNHLPFVFERFCAFLKNETFSKFLNRKKPAEAGGSMDS